MDNTLRALLGSLFIIGTMICCVTCLYKYAVCQEKRKVSKISYNNIHSEYPQEV